MDLESRASGLVDEVQGIISRAEALLTDCAAGSQPREVMANLQLGIRHLEDAQSRIEKAWVKTNTSTKACSSN